MQYDLALIGLAVMGQNLALNFRDQGFDIAVYNRSYSKTQDFLEHLSDDYLEHSDTSTNQTIGKLNGFEQIAELIQSLKSPRVIVLMVKAGSAVDSTIEQIVPLLDPDDIIIDGGNSDFQDSQRRFETLQQQSIRFIGSGVSGGEEGARFGPSVMPGGDESAWPIVKPLLQSIAAKVEGTACCEWMGKGGAGHFVKMVHNGIEYGDMQLIAETYHLLKTVHGFDNPALAQTFKQWSEGKLESYLIEITANIFEFNEDGHAVIDKILDTAGQKGTGRWTVVNAMEHASPLTIIAEAVFARTLSSKKDLRIKASQELSSIANKTPTKLANSSAQEETLKILENALFAAKILSYAQGFMLLQEASKHYDWKLELGDIAKIWRGGCIIRSQFLNQISEAFEQDPKLENLVFADYFKKTITECEPALREAVIQGITHGISLPSLSSALSFLDGLNTDQSPANLIQAQRDYFGAHTYERIDKPRGEFFHTDWTGLKGQATSGAYDA